MHEETRKREAPLWAGFFFVFFVRLRGFTSEIIFTSEAGAYFSHNCAIHTALLAIRLYRDRVAGSRLRGADRINIFLDYILVVWE